jgi:hypothetical protein
MSSLPPSDTPSDMLILLIRLDERVNLGLVTINQKLDEIKGDISAHDSRITTMERELADRAIWKQRFIELESSGQ